MKFPSIRKQQSYTVTVPQLNGGLNKAVPPHLIEDNQLSDVKNMWYRNGALQTRPGLKFCDRAEQVGTNMSVDQVVSCGNMALAYCFGEISEQSHLVSAIIDESGRFIDGTIAKETFKHKEGIATPQSILLIPVNADAGEALSDCDAIVMVGFSDGDFQFLGISRKVTDDGEGNETETIAYQNLSPYVPTVILNGRPAKEYIYQPPGGLYESYNMIANEYKCKFTSDGEGIYYCLPEQDMDPCGVTVTYTDGYGKTHTHCADFEAKWEWSNSDGYVESKTTTDDGFRLTYNRTRGIFFFAKDNTPGDDAFDWTPIALEKGSAVNNVEITVRKNDQKSREKIGRMKKTIWFGGDASGLTKGTRLFLSGNSQHPNLVHWSSLNNPLYFPMNNYSYVGEESSSVTGFGKQGELLVIFKDRETYCTQYIQGEVTAEDIENQTAMDIEATRAVFPIIQLHPSIGCDCPDTIRLCNNRLVWLNSDGRVYGLFTAGQYSERNIRELSGCIDRGLRSHDVAEMKGASSAEFEQHYLLLVGSVVYVMDYSSSGFTHYSSYSSDEKAQRAVQWYIWDFEDTDLFNGDNSNHLVMTGRKALWFSQDAYRNPITLTFSEGESDISHNRGENTFTDGATRIPCSFTTKLYDFTRPDLKKAVQQLYLSVRDDADNKIHVSYLTDRYVDEDAVVITGDDEGGDGYVRTCRLTPNVNLAQAFGIRCDSDDGMAVQGILMKYKYQGVVR